MLVWHKESMGYSAIGPHRIYGKKYNRGTMPPTNIPYDLFKENQHWLIEAEYTTEWLEKKFNKKFPSVIFKYSELHKLHDDLLIEIAILCGVDYKMKWGHGHLSLEEKNALKKGILYMLER